MAIAFFSTWTTFGTWLPGDERGWYQPGHGIQFPNALRELEAKLIMKEEAITLDHDQRQIVIQTILTHCVIREWTLHAVDCRSNHVHVVVTAGNSSIEIPREQFKSWCTRKLKDAERNRGHSEANVRKCWWTQRGWDVYIDDEKQLEAVIEYVLEQQDR